MMRWIYCLPVVLFLGLAAVAGYFLSVGEDPHALPSALIDRPVPETNLALLGEEKRVLTTADFSGRKITLVNFFASWCVPCRAEHAQLMALTKTEGVTLLGIAWKDKPTDAAAFLADLGNPFRDVALDVTGRSGIDWGVYGVPETYIIDGRGKIRYRHVGPIMPQDMGTIQTILQKIRSAVVVQP